MPIPGCQTSGPGRCVFLDRDGTLIDDVGYLSRTDRIRIKDGVLDGVRRLVEERFIPVVVTNQSGVARGLIDPSELQEIHRILHHKFLERQAPVYGWYFCPHLPPDQLRPEEEDGADPSLLTRCDCRKPEPGLWEQALNDLSASVDLAASWSVGDRMRDVDPGCELGTGGVLLSEAPDQPTSGNDVHPAKSFGDVVDVICETDR